MDEWPPALAHRALEQVFPDVFYVTGAMHTELLGAHWEFSRNMTVIRDRGALTLVNSVRLDATGLRQLEQLGRVAHVVTLGSLHGRDDAFYKARYGAQLWMPAGMTHPDALVADRTLAPEHDAPVANCSVFQFRTTRVPEAILHLHREGGILVACDALLNWCAPDEYFCDATRTRMTTMGFFAPANLGPVFLQHAAPQREDYARLCELDFKHVLSAHGTPLRDSAREACRASVQRVFASARQ